MSMTGAQITAHDNGDGTSVEKLKLKFSTTWTFDVTASSDTSAPTSNKRAH
jgi:hypothetical protein